MKLPLSLAAGATALLVAACGGSGASTTASTGGGAYSAPAPASTPAATANSAAVVKTGSGAPGSFLVDGKGRALYLWAADHGKSSTCSGECAHDWPPLITHGAPKAGNGVNASLLATTKRSDGSLEVTYAGHPLYTFEGDSAAGQTAGQGSTDFGAPWWVVAPDGTAVTH